MKPSTALAFLSLAFACASAHSISIPTVSIGDPGNPADHPTGFGSVSYDYRIGATEVTNQQYAEFLNAVAATDFYNLYNIEMGSDTRGGIFRSGSRGNYTYSLKSAVIGQGPGGSDYTYANKPVVFVSWYDAIRFANWLHNGQGSGGTETGAYTLGPVNPQGVPINGFSITRNPDANWWLPSEDEWFKAAYYDTLRGIYYEYPTGTNTRPDNNLPSVDTGNSANFKDDDGFTTGNSSYPMTDAGSYLLTENFNSTFDQGGNVREWNETIIPNCCGGLFRGERGGDWSTAGGLRREDRGDNNPLSESTVQGFRLASLPTPGPLIGDYNQDDSVDAADYLIWRKQVGDLVEPCSGGDANCNGFVENAEYQPWYENYGRTLSGGAGGIRADNNVHSPNVPEPTSLVLVGLGIFGSLHCRLNRCVICRPSYHA